MIATARSGSDDSDLSRVGLDHGHAARTWPPSRPGARSTGSTSGADVFALGSILCEILTGKPAFLGRNSARDPAQGRPGRHGRRPRPGSTPAGRTRADRPGPRTVWPASARIDRATPACSPVRITSLPGRGAAEAPRGRARPGRGRGHHRRGAEASQAPGRPGRVDPGHRGPAAAWRSSTRPGKARPEPRPGPRCSPTPRRW